MKKSQGTELNFDRTRTIPSATPLVKRYACAICQLRTEVLVCRECANDPQSLARVRAWLNGNTDQAYAAQTTWDATRAAQQATWDIIQSHADDRDFPARCAKARAAGSVAGKLLDAHAAYEHAMLALAMERERLDKALRILEGMA